VKVCSGRKEAKEFSATEILGGGGRGEGGETDISSFRERERRHNQEPEKIPSTVYQGNEGKNACVCRLRVKGRKKKQPL